MSFLDPVITLLAYLALPVILVALYDRFVLQPQRPKTRDGEPVPGPAYVRVAGTLLPFVIVAAVMKIGVNEVFTWAREIARPLSWLALPVGLWCALDSWFLAPRRQIAARSADVPDPVLLRIAYAVLPVLVIAVIVRLISAESLDFSLVLLILSLATGMVWLLDHLLVRRRREAAAAAVTPPVALREPGTVDYARSFFPVAFIVLVVRAFIFEPFRIPSDSMMPTLLDGDFIVVNKYAYGLRWPVLNRKFLDTGSPQRGDVVVFKYPRDPNVNYIKRLVGLPGDRVEVRDDQLVINGEAISVRSLGEYADGCYANMRLWEEKIGDHTHQVLSCRSPLPLSDARAFSYSGEPMPPLNCDRKQLARRYGGFICNESTSDREPDRGDHAFDVVPPGHYLMIGDNRDNSEDSRVWSYVPDQNLVGKATRIWLNFDPGRSSQINWGRIGDAID
jgi:signal peptidase I